MRRLLICVLFIALGACEPSTSDNSAASNGVAAAEATPAKPTHNYSELQNGVYYYITGVSDNDKAAGKAAADVVGVKYLGQNNGGEYTLALISDDSSVVGKAYCRNPCVIVRTSSGQKFGAEGTVISEAFADAIAGELDKAKP